MEWKISQTRCSGYRKAITTRVGSIIKQQDNEACTGVIYKKSYELLKFYGRTKYSK